MALVIELVEKPQVPLEVEPIRPDLNANSNLKEILQTPIFHGKEQVEFGSFFKVEGTPEDRVHRWVGDFSGVHWIGKGLTEGEIHIEGSAGRHVGSEMEGGTILVSENVSDWVGAEMKGGLIRVDGDAGHLVGAAYRGSPKGMTGGTLLVRGKSGNEVGHTMRRGMICVGGVGDLAGFNMLAGTILVFGECGIRHGAGMRRGTIGFFGESQPELLPTFKFACRQKLDVLTIASEYLKSNEFDRDFPAQVDLYHGDFLEGGRGEIMLGTNVSL